jgi:hypothetical protein
VCPQHLRRDEANQQAVYELLYRFRGDMTGFKHVATWKVVAPVSCVGVHAIDPSATGFAWHKLAPFGWQRFSRGALHVRFKVVSDDGRTESYSAAKILVRNRDDIATGRYQTSAWT